MKKIAIYNHKGGVGKTTIGMMLADYLAYHEGSKVCVLDFDNPSYHFSSCREFDNSVLKNPVSALSAYLSQNPSVHEPYDVFKIQSNRYDRYDATEVYMTVLEMMKGDYDYLIYDFAGRYGLHEPISIIGANDLLDFVAIPTDTDNRNQKAAAQIGSLLRESSKAVLRVFWNRIAAEELAAKNNRLKAGEDEFRRLGFEMMETPIRDIRKFKRSADEHLFIRNTLCYPERYINLWCPELASLLEGFKTIIDGID